MPPEFGTEGQQHIKAQWLTQDKVHPRTGNEGPEGEKRYSSTLSLISELDRGGWLTPYPGRLTPSKKIRYPLRRRLGEPQGRSGQWLVCVWQALTLKTLHFFPHSVLRMILTINRHYSPAQQLHTCRSN